MTIKDKTINKDESIIDIGDYIINMNKEIKNDIRIVFMGTPSFAVNVLDRLIKEYNVVLVVCQPDREKDRKGNIIIPPIKKLALDNGIEVFQPLKLKNDYQKILDVKPDIIITCAYGQIVPKIILDYPKYGCINVHGSLLPKLRGGAPIHWALINGEEYTGITIMYMSEQMDAGDIISQEKIRINDDYILDTLYRDMSLLGAKLLMETLPNIIEGNIKRIKQDNSLVTFGYNIKKSDELIDFSNTGKDIFNQVRGLNSIPGAFCLIDGKRMKIFKVSYINKVTDGNNYGEIISVDNESIIVKCLDGYIKILDIQLEGKKRCLVKDYFNGIDKNKLIGKVLR